MSVNSEQEQNILANITTQLKKTSQSSQEALGPCGGEGWTRVAYLDMTDPNTTCPSGWRHNTGYTQGEHVVKVVLAASHVTLSFSLSVEEPTLVCVAELKATRTAGQMHLRSIIMEMQQLLKNPILVVSVSHMALHDNTSGHLQPVLQAVTLTLKPVPVIQLPTTLALHLWAETTSVNQEPTRCHLMDFIQTILCGMVTVVL